MTDWEAFDQKLALADVLQMLYDCNLFTTERISLIVEDAAVLIWFARQGQHTWRPTPLKLQRGEGYSEEGLKLDSQIMFVNADPAGLPRVRGIAWGTRR